MRKALVFAVIAAALFGRDLFLQQAHAVEPVPLDPIGTQPQSNKTTTTRNDGGVKDVRVEHVVALDSNASAKVGATTTRVVAELLGDGGAKDFPPTALAGRRNVTVQNHGPEALWCCFSSATCQPVAHSDFKVPKADSTSGAPGQVSLDFGDAVPVRCKPTATAQADGGTTTVLEAR